MTCRPSLLTFLLRTALHTAPRTFLLLFPGLQLSLEQEARVLSFKAELQKAQDINTVSPFFYFFVERCECSASCLVLMHSESGGHLAKMMCVTGKTASIVRLRANMFL